MGLGRKGRQEGVCCLELICFLSAACGAEPRAPCGNRVPGAPLAVHPRPVLAMGPCGTSLHPGREPCELGAPDPLETGSRVTGGWVQAGGPGCPLWPCLQCWHGASGRPKAVAWRLQGAGCLEDCPHRGGQWAQRETGRRGTGPSGGLPGAACLEAGG